MTATTWFWLGFLLGSVAMVFAMKFRFNRVVDEMGERLLVAEARVAEAERWAMVLGASLYGESEGDAS